MTRRSLQVCEGRDISRDVIESLAGGRVFTGLSAWTRCNPDETLEALASGHIVESANVASASSEKENEEQAESSSSSSTSTPASASSSSSKGPSPGPLAKPKKLVKAVSLTSNWRTVNATGLGENNTILIEHDGQVESPVSAEDGEEGEAQPGLVAGLTRVAETVMDVETSSPGESVGGNADALIRAVAEPGELVKRGTDEVDESMSESKASQLAEEAHQAAQQVLSEAEAAAVANGQGKDKPKGPYGRGLIDSIGGIWESAYMAMVSWHLLQTDRIMFALAQRQGRRADLCPFPTISGRYVQSISLQAEIERMITEDGLTLEQAQAKIRPGCQREVAEDGELDGS